LALATAVVAGCGAAALDADGGMACCPALGTANQMQHKHPASLTSDMERLTKPQSDKGIAHTPLATAFAIL
jgi:hypothetical protein